MISAGEERAEDGTEYGRIGDVALDLRECPSGRRAEQVRAPSGGVDHRREIFDPRSTDAAHRDSLNRNPAR